MRSACLVRTRFILNSGIGLGESQDPPPLGYAPGSSEFRMLPLALSATCRSTTADSAISCTTSCTGWTFLSRCSTSCVQRSTDVCSTKHHSTWRTDASTPQTLLVGSICVRRLPFRTATPTFNVRSLGLFCGRQGDLVLVTTDYARSVTPGSQNFYFSRFTSIRCFAIYALYKSTVDTDKHCCSSLLFTPENGLMIVLWPPSVSQYI